MFDRIVLVGAGRTSGSIVDRLARIAPLTVIDVSAAALDIMGTRTSIHPDEGSDAVGGHPVVKRVGDGTSRLVLEDLRGDPKSIVALVVAPGDDRAAIECCRLALALDYKPVVAIVNERASLERCEEVGASALVRAEIVGQLVEQSLQHSGLGIGASFGLARGEVLEFRVLPSSPAIGVPLAKLRADGWRVAAIYRGAELVLPTGTTMIAADDRVLVVGDPKQLPHVAESLRVGLPTFPLLHGPNVVVYLPDGRDDGVETEAEALLVKTRATALVRAFEGAEGRRTVLDTPGPNGETTRKHHDVIGLEGADVRRHLPMLHAKRPGVIVTKVGKRDVTDVALGRGGRDSVLCNEAGVPILFSHGATYERVVLCVTDGDTDLAVAETALDLARIFSLPFVVEHVRLPGYLQTADRATDKLVETIAQRARLHGLKPDILQVEGNPVVQWLAKTNRADLIVVGRRPGLRDSFSRPDLALRVARKAKGSVLVVTVEP